MIETDKLAELEQKFYTLEARLSGLEQKYSLLENGLYTEHKRNAGLMGRLKKMREEYGLDEEISPPKQEKQPEQPVLKAGMIIPGFQILQKPKD